MARPARAYAVKHRAYAPPPFQEEQTLTNPYTFDTLTIDPARAMRPCAHLLAPAQRSLAQRILEVRKELAREWAQDLSFVAAENADLLRESLASCLLSSKDVLTTSDDLDDDGQLRKKGGGGGGDGRG